MQKNEMSIASHGGANELRWPIPLWVVRDAKLERRRNSDLGDRQAVSKHEGKHRRASPF